MSQAVCCPSVVIKTAIKYRSSFVSWDVFGCIFKITIAFWFGILNAWKPGDSELDHFFGLRPGIHAPVPACIVSSAHQVQQSHSGLTKQISVLLSTSVQFQFPPPGISSSTDQKCWLSVNQGPKSQRGCCGVGMCMSALFRRWLLHQGQQCRETAVCQNWAVPWG